MGNRLRSMVICCMILLTFFTCFRIDNTSNFVISTTDSFANIHSSVMMDSTTYASNDGYSQIQQQDYWRASHSTRMSTTMFKRSQLSCRNNDKNALVYVVLDIVSKVILFSFIMILFATSGTGLSMPFQCLLFYIQNEDGKKRIA